MKLANSDSLPANTNSPNLRDDLKFVALVWLFSRVWFAFYAYQGHLAHPFREKIIEGFSGVPNWFLNVWTTYDSQYFLEIARSGYTVKSSAFFPLYPLLLRPFGPDENSMALAGVVISNLAFLVALFYFLQLTRRDYNDQTARIAIWTLAFFPAAIFGMAVYTESLFLMLGVLSFWCFRQNKWGWGGFWCVLASLTRNSGPILTAVLLVEWFIQKKSGKNPPLWGIGIALLPTLVFIGVQAYFKHQFGDALSSVSNQALFHRHIMLPIVPIWRDFLGIITGDQLNIVSVLNWACTVGSFFLVWKNRKRVQPADAVFLIAVLLMQLTFARIYPPYTNSSLRYMVTTWPFIQLLAFEVSLFNTNKIRTIVSLACLLLSALTYAYIFGQKMFVG